MKITEEWLKNNGHKPCSELLQELSIKEFLSLFVKFSREVYKKENSLWIP